MKQLPAKSPKLRLFFTLAIFFIALFTLLRLAFLLFFKADITPDSGSLLIQSFLLGFRFDARLSALLLIPAILLVNLPLRDTARAKILNSLYSVVIAGLVFLYIVDAGYYSYLKLRLNATALQFLQNPIISFGMVRESYPWPWLILLLIIITVSLSYAFNKFVTRRIYTPKLTSPLKVRIFKGTLFFFVLAFGIYGSVKKYPLRWSQAFFTTDTLASNLALNPILYMADTYTFRNSEYDLEATKKYYNVVAEFFKIDENNRQELNLIRRYEGDPRKAALQPNVVIIITESLAWFKTGIGGSEVNPTPHLDKLAQESLVFKNFYTPTTATARSVFAAITSLPDTSKTKTSSRNPFFVNQHAIASHFDGYDKFYFLGGSANWGNIRGVLSNNIPNLKIFEEGSYDSPVVDVWGISDLNLFKEAQAAISENKKQTKNPFFSIIQTAGFHRPYTIPRDNDDFVVLTTDDISEELVKTYGFDSIAEFNAMRLQDYALGRFMEIVKQEPWYDNTIFVIFGDHALPHNNALNIPEWKRSIANSYHVPLLIHWPSQIEAGMEDKIASELDVMATVAGLAGVPYKTRAFGRDLFNERYDDYRVAFSYNWSAPFHVSLIDNEFYFEFIPGKENSGKLIRYSEDPSNKNVRAQYPEKFESMNELARGLYEASRYLLNHNSKIVE